MALTLLRVAKPAAWNCLLGMVFNLYPLTSIYGAERDVAKKTYASMRTGGTQQQQIDAMIARFKSKSPAEKEAAKRAELLMILPAEILKYVPIALVDDLRFSLSDDPYSRAMKYLGLGLRLQHLSADHALSQGWREAAPRLAADPILLDQNLQTELAYLCFSKAIEYAERLNIETDIAQHQRPDYFLSLAQIKVWAAFAVAARPDKDETELEHIAHLSEEALRLADNAEIALNDLPSQDAFKHAANFLRLFVNLSVERLSDDDLKEMAVDTNTRAAFATNDDAQKMLGDYAIAGEEQACARARTHLLGLFPEANQDKLSVIIDTFRSLRYDQRRTKLASKLSLLPRAEKLAMIMRQNPVDNYGRLLALHKVAPRMQTYINHNGLLDKAAIKQSYRWLAPNAADASFIDNIKLRYAAAIARLRHSVHELSTTGSSRTPADSALPKTPAEFSMPAA